MSAATDTWTAGTAFTRVIEALERAGCRVEGTGRQRRAQCPHHEDRQPSLGLTDGMDRVLLICRAGCDSEDVLADLDLSWADLRGDDRGERPSEDAWTPWRDRCPCTPVARYRYTDERGELLYEHVRGQHKEFAFRRPDPASRSGWRWSLGDTRRVLYRLPAILAAPDSACIFVTEGESDADALVAAGEIATTTDSGALTGRGGKQWRPEWSEALAGRDVLVCADRDAPGRAHARHVAASIEGTARSVWIVEAAAGKDARDHLAAGLAVPDLVGGRGECGTGRQLDTAHPASQRAVGRNEERRKELRATGPRPPVPDPAMYAGILGRMIVAADPTTEADPVGVYASLLAMAGSAIGTSVYVQIGNTRHPLIIWPLLFGNTGSGRKGEATNTARVFFRSSSPEADEFTVSGLSSGEGLIERIRDQEDEEDKGGTEDKRLLVVEPEFAQVMARAKREGSTLAAVLRQAWDGGSLSVLNRAHLRAAGSHVVIVGHITPQEFRIKLAESDMAGGTYNRFLPFFVDRSKRLPLPAGLAPEVIASLADLLAKGIKEARDMRQITLDQGARKLWSEETYEELTTYDDEAAVYTQFIQRAAPYCRRIAALLCALDGRSAASRDDIEAAAAAVRYSIASAKYILGHTSRNPNLDKIRRALGTAGPDGLTRSEVSALFSRNLPAASLGALLSELISHGEAEEFTKPTGGRAVAYRACIPEVDSAA